MVRVSSQIRVLSRTVTSDKSWCETEWDGYHKEHPGTKKTPSQYVTECEARRKDTGKEKEEGKDEGAPKEEPKSKKTSPKKAPPLPKSFKPDEETTQTLTEMGIDKSDLPDLREMLTQARATYERKEGKGKVGDAVEQAIRWLSGHELYDENEVQGEYEDYAVEQQAKGKTPLDREDWERTEYEGEKHLHPAHMLAMAIKWLVTKFKQVIDFDDFVMDLPSSTKELSDALEEISTRASKVQQREKRRNETRQRTKERSEESVNRSYKQYVSEAEREDKKPMSRADWERKVLEKE